MDKNLKILSVLLIIILAISFVAAYPVYVRPLDAKGDQRPDTEFNYVLNFTENADCTNVLLSFSGGIRTDKYGVAFFDVNTTGLSSIPSYLCEYRGEGPNGVISLRKIHEFSDSFSRNSFGQDLNFTNIFGNVSGVVGLVESDPLAYNGTLVNQNELLDYRNLSNNVFWGATGILDNVTLIATGTAASSLGAEFVDAVEDIIPSPVSEDIWSNAGEEIYEVRFTSGTENGNRYLVKQTKDSFLGINNLFEFAEDTGGGVIIGDTFDVYLYDWADVNITRNLDVAGNVDVTGDLSIGGLFNPPKIGTQVLNIVKSLTNLGNFANPYDETTKLKIINFESILGGSIRENRTGLNVITEPDDNLQFDNYSGRIALEIRGEPDVNMTLGSFISEFIIEDIGGAFQDNYTETINEGFGIKSILTVSAIQGAIEDFYFYTLNATVNVIGSFNTTIGYYAPDLSNTGATHIWSFYGENDGYFGGNVTANYFFGNGSQLTDVGTPYDQSLNTYDNVSFINVTGTSFKTVDDDVSGVCSNGTDTFIGFIGGGIC